MRGGAPLAPLLATLLLAPLLGGCGSGPPAPGQPLGPSEARERFAGLWDAYERDLLEGDASGLAAWFTSDALLMEPELEAMRGRSEIESFLEQTFRAFRVTAVDIRPREVAVHGAMAYEWGTATETVEERATGAEARTWEIRYSAVWMQGSDGRWRIHRLLLSPMAPPGS